MEDVAGPPPGEGAALFGRITRERGLHMRAPVIPGMPDCASHRLREWRRHRVRYLRHLFAEISSERKRARKTLQQKCFQKAQPPGAIRVDMNFAVAVCDGRAFGIPSQPTERPARLASTCRELQRERLHRPVVWMERNALRWIAALEKDGIGQLTYLCLDRLSRRRAFREFETGEGCEFALDTDEE